MSQIGGPRGEPRVKKEPRDIEAEIEETRAVIGERLDEIGERLTPENVKVAAKQKVREKAVEAKDAAVGKLRGVKDAAAESVGSAAHEAKERVQRAGTATVTFARDNPMPLALIGVGLGWLVASNMKRRAERERLYEPREYYGPRDYGARQYFGSSPYPGPGDWPETAERFPSGFAAPEEAVRAGGERDELGGKVRRAAGSARERVSHAAHRVEQRVEHAGARGRELADRARAGVGRARSNAVDLAYDNPLAVGAAALFAGIGVGLLLPPSRRENEMIGETRDRIVGGAREAVEEVGRAVKETARDVAGAAPEPPPIR
jgi:uncharacterized protein YjbJ (UPF0337 family)